jgi:hypothetical protein
MIERYLEDLEGRIEPEVEDDLLEQWRRFVEGSFQGDIFLPRRLHSAPPKVTWPQVLVNEALDNLEQMALQQLKVCSETLAKGSGDLLAVRANYGTGIIPTLFGAELFIMEREMDTLPTTRPLVGGSESIRRLVDRGIPNIYHALGGKTLATGQYFLALVKDYPKISRYVHLYHPDTQGPMDICELLWGSGLFLAVVNEPELVKELLGLITETYIRFMRAWQQIIPPCDPYAVHWGLLHKGTIMLRDDSAMNFSPRMFEEFIEPHDQRLLDEFGGGAAHFCGRGDHYIQRLAGMRGVYAIHMSQPEYNDIEKIFRYTVDRGVQLIGFSQEAAEEALRRGRELRGRVHVWQGE